MNYKFSLTIFLIFFLFGCEITKTNKFNKSNIKFENKYKNSGFALVYDQINTNIKPLENRSLNIYHKSLKKRSVF